MFFKNALIAGTVTKTPTQIAPPPRLTMPPTRRPAHPGVAVWAAGRAEEPVDAGPSDRRVEQPARAY